MKKPTKLHPGTVHGEGAADTDVLRAAFQALRQRWPDEWPGLPRVFDGSLRWLVQSGYPTVQAGQQRLLRIAMAVSRLIEDEGAQQAAAGCEPAYHNRLHIADTVVAMTVLLRARRWVVGAMGAAVQREELLCLLAMLIHDFQHNGRINTQPGEIERRSLEAFLPHALRLRIALDDWSLLNRLVLHTDPASVGALHEAFCAAPPTASRRIEATEMAVLVTEADVLASALSHPGQALGHCLMRERAALDPDRAARLATPEGRLAFLTFGARFSSSAALHLGMPAQVQEQVVELTRAIQARRLPPTHPR